MTDQSEQRACLSRSQRSISPYGGADCHRNGCSTGDPYPEGSGSVHGEQDPMDMRSLCAKVVSCWR